MPHDILAASPWVARFAPLVPAGEAVLDLACGGGRHGRLFLERGCRVTLLDKDVSSVADLAGAAEIVQADLEDGSPWPLPDRRFAAVIVTNYLHRPLLPAIIGSIGDGGVLIYETFAHGNEAYGRPRNPDHLLAPGELLAACAGLQVAAYEHGILVRPAPVSLAVVQRICARRGSEPAVLG